MSAVGMVGLVATSGVGGKHRSEAEEDGTQVRHVSCGVVSCRVVLSTVKSVGWTKTPLMSGGNTFQCSADSERRHVIQIERLILLYQ